jgi:ferredoxin
MDVEMLDEQQSVRAQAAARVCPVGALKVVQD